MYKLSKVRELFSRLVWKVKKYKKLVLVVVWVVAVIILAVVIYNKNQTSNCVIKWNISLDWERIYHMPWCDSYSATDISTYEWEERFCTESQARNAGRRKARNCD